MDSLEPARNQQLVLELAPLLLCTEPKCYYMVLRAPGTVDCTLCDFTHVNQASWSSRNLPAILYEPGPTANTQAEGPAMQTLAKVFGKRINHFPELPWHISSKVEGWRLEAWFRTDNRITASDIMDRVHPEYRHEISPAKIDQRRESFLHQFDPLFWEPPLDGAPMAYQTVRHDGVMRYDENEILNCTGRLTDNANLNLENGDALPPVAGPLTNAVQLEEQVVQTDGPPLIANLYSNRLVPPRNSYYRPIAATSPSPNGIRVLHAERSKSRESHNLRPN